MKKHIYSLFAITICFIALALGVCAAKPFKDVPTTHWAYKYVNPMVDRGIVNGYDGNVFKPNGNVTRAEWAKLLTSAADIPIHDDYKEIMENACLDAKSTSWHASYTVALLPYFDYSFTTGKNGETYFACEASKPVTRLEMAKSIVKVADYDEEAPDYSLIKGFKDYSKISSDDRKYIAIAVQKGIVTGFEDNTFRPFDNVTRAQAATMLFRTFIGEEKQIEAPEKPYIVDTLVDASIEYSKEATLDESGNFYFIDSVDNCVYAVDIEDGTCELYFDPIELSYDKYSNYQATQVFYDTHNDILLLNGYFKSAAEPGKIPSDDEMHTVYYDITDGKCEFYCEPFWSNEYYSYIEPSTSTLQTAFDNKHILAYFDNGEGFRKVNIKTGNMGEIINGDGQSGCEDESVTSLRYKNEIHKFNFRNNRNGIEDVSFVSHTKYNFSEGKFRYAGDHTSIIDMHGIGLKGKFCYFWENDKQKMYKMDVETQMISPIDITFSEEFIEFADMGSFSNINSMFYIVDDDTLIFYDYDMEAFRILRKNEVEETVFVAPEVEVASYFLFFKKFDKENYPSDSSDNYIAKSIETISYHANGVTFSDGGSYESGGNFVEFKLNGNNLTVHYTSVGSAPQNRIAEIMETVNLSTAIIAENTLQVPFDNDGWGNSGVLTIKFNPGNGGSMVKCTVSDLVIDSYALWFPYASDDWYQPEY